MSEFVFGGLLITPLVKAALMALVLFVPLRRLLVWSNIHRWAWHPLLAEGAILVCLVAAINLALP